LIIAGLVLFFSPGWGVGDRGRELATAGVIQSRRDVGCAAWHDCHRLALAAAERGEYESFHDLAWRAVQTGPPKDPALMYLLARAQSLSGRPHDALIMLQRLAEMGVTSDAATNDDFMRVRQLPGWPDLEARIAAAARGHELASVAGRPAAVTPSLVAEAVRFSTPRFAVAGLAYDAVSHRFLLGDRLGRKLIAVAEGTNHTVDLVRADSAGFDQISAIEIDAKRGDLWVASAATAGAGGTLHRLQLVSGRPLRSFRVAADLESVALVDLAVSPAGAVLVLDSASRQLFALRTGGTSLERVTRIDAEEPASVAAGDGDGIAYVAHRDGVSRIDLRSRTATLVAPPNGVSLAHLERIRWHRHALIAVAADPDGSRRIVRLALNASGRAVTAATTLESSVSPAGQMLVTISGDELIYMVVGDNNAVARPSTDTLSSLAELVAYRVPLR
jgi:hypothetical protein